MGGWTMSPESLHPQFRMRFSFLLFSAAAAILLISRLVTGTSTPLSAPPHETDLHHVSLKTDLRRARCTSSRAHGAASVAGRLELSATEAKEASAREAEFVKVSETGVWGAPEGAPDGDTDTVSGGGSFIHTTVTARGCISSWLKKYAIETVLDAPCGDALWQGLVDGFGGGSYTGADISRPALARAMARQRNINANMQFLWMDVTTEIIDGCIYDAVMYRDFIQHLSLANGVRALQNARDGGVRYLIASTFPTTEENVAQDALQPSHKNNLRKAPYLLPVPLEDCDNHVGDGDGSRLQLFRLN